MQCQLGREEVKVQSYPKIVKAKKLKSDQILIVSEKLVSLTALIIIYYYYFNNLFLSDE